MCEWLPQVKNADSSHFPPSSKSGTTHQMHRTSQTEGQPQPDQRQIIDALSAVLESDKFTAAPQMSAFLKYVVEQAASGNMTRIKAYTVAIDALGKPDSFDPQNDPVVRVLAGRLRAALASYYEAHPDTDIRITMRPGSYVPSFIFRSSIKQAEKAHAASDNNPATLSTVNTQDAAPISTHAKTQHARTNQNDSHARVATVEPEALSNQTTAKPNAAQISNTDNNDRGALIRWMFRLPTVGIALAAVGFFVGTQLTNYRVQSATQPAVSSAATTVEPSVPMRDRPGKVSLFISALDQGNSLNDQLNTMISGVFSESEELRVYRILETTNVSQHWPEDYLVSVDVLPLPSETRVSIQLVEAQTGRISHAENLSLSKQASEGLSAGEFDTITQFARDLVSDEGPLFNDYRIKQTVANAQ